MHVLCVAALRAHYGLEPRLVKVIEPYQMLGLLKEDFMQVLGADVAGVAARNTLFGFSNEDWKPFVTPWGQSVLVSALFHTTPDGNGGLLIYPQGDTTAPPSGHMPAASFFLSGIRDITEWYMATATQQEYIHAVFTRQTEIALDNLAKIHAMVGDAIDTLFICGTDFGTQQGTFCSSQTFKELYQPYYTRINDWIHAHTGWKTFKHSSILSAPLHRSGIRHH